MRTAAIRGFSTAAVLCFLLSTSASADVLYDDGPVSAWGIFAPGLYIANSFTPTANSTLTGVTAGLLVLKGDTPVTVDWSIWDSVGPGNNGALLDGPATVTLTNTFAFAGTGIFSNFDIYTSSFMLPSIDLGAGTYWLQLANATTVEEQSFSIVGWVQDSGPSQAWGSAVGFLTADTSCGEIVPGAPSCGEAFQIQGMTSGPTTVPEPGNLALFGTGILLLTGPLRRKLSR